MTLFRDTSKASHGFHETNSFFLLEPEGGVVSVVYTFLHLRSAVILRLVIIFTAIRFDIFVSKTSSVTTLMFR